MSTTDSTSTTSSSSTTTSTIPTSTAAGRPGITAGNGTCTLNVEEISPRLGRVVWTNCCIRENPSLNCPPQGQRYATCPAGYLNCADPASHAEMCSVKLDVFGYSDATPLNTKCCPKDFTCGLSWQSPCELISEANSTFPPYINPDRVLTNALYLSTAGVFAGCNDAVKLSPGAIGGIVGAAIIGLCLIFGSIMWYIRRRLYRDPMKPHHKGKKVVSDRRGRARNLEIVVTRDYEIEERGPNSGSRVVLSGQPDLPLSALWMNIGDAARLSRAAQRSKLAE